MRDRPPPAIEKVIRETEAFVRLRLAGDCTGHDWWHVSRVRRLALYLARAEGADPVKVELAALLHDIEDHKFSGSKEAGARAAQEWLSSKGLDSEMVDAVASIVCGISFSNLDIDDVPLSVEGLCVRDADRLDALGAIGIARAFAYGGATGQPIYAPPADGPPSDGGLAMEKEADSSVSHFNTKLLHLRDRMSTRAGRALATVRHDRLLRYLQEFHAEWNCDDVQ